MCKNGEKPRFFIHRIVAECYLPNPENLPQINHKDGNKKNNAVANLEWCSSSDNHKHSFRELGRKPTRVCGEQSGACKITIQQIEDAKTRRAAGELLKDIAREHGVNRKYLGALTNGRCVRHG